jgi:serine/threonine protein kinase
VVQLVQEYVAGGTLSYYIARTKTLSEDRTRYAIKQILKAVTVLHSKGFVHRDLKPNNVLLVGSDIYDGIKICDFGLCGEVERPF